MSLKLLQKAAGVKPDGDFGPKTFKAASAYLGITDHACAVHFFAQVAHETGGFKRFTENLNYSQKGLRAIFGKYFPTDELARPYARKPEVIANKVYANRMGNGDKESGDGWRFRGRGALQLTGKDNYTAFSEFMNDPCILETPEIVSQQYSFNSAMFFFTNNNLWSICEKGLDKEIIRKVTKRINGGYNGLDHRIELTNKYSKYSL